MESRVVANGVRNNVSERRESEHFLDFLNHGLSHSNPPNDSCLQNVSCGVQNGSCVQSGSWGVQNSSCVQTGSWANYSPLSASSPIPVAEAWANFYATENHRLRGEIEMLKFELQKCYGFMSKQETHLKEVKEFEQVQKRYLERQKKKASDGQKDVKYLEKQLFDRQIELQAINARTSQLQAEFEKLTRTSGEAQKKIAAQEKQIQELETIMVEQQNAVEQLSLRRTVSEGKLDGIREFVKQINSEFVRSLETLKRDHSLNFNATGEIDIPSFDEHSNNADDEDEVDLKNLERNLSSLSLLVKTTFEEMHQIRSNGNPTGEPSGISKVLLKKQVGGDYGTAETWSVVPNQQQPSVEDENFLYLSNSTELMSSSSSPGFNCNIRCNHKPRLHRAKFDKFRPNCCSCGYQAGDRNALRKHLRYFNLPLLFPCRLCKRRFVGMSYLKTHYHQRHKIPYDSKKDCILCGATFPTLGDVLNHRDLVHQQNQQISLPDNNGFEKEDPTATFFQFMDVPNSEDLSPSQFKCSCCSQTFENQEKLEQHIIDTTEEVYQEKND